MSCGSLGNGNLRTPIQLEQPLTVKANVKDLSLVMSFNLKQAIHVEYYKVI